jgi:hypothetical protein
VTRDKLDEQYVPGGIDPIGDGPVDDAPGTRAVGQS